MDGLIAFITFISVTSIAAERFTEILKRAFLEKIVKNGVVYQVLSGLFGGCLGYINPPTGLPIDVNQYVMALIVGLTVSGGSGVWSDILGVLKDYRKSSGSEK